VIVDDVDVTPHAPKERSLLAMLVLQPGHVVRADRMVDELWSNLPVEQARRVLWVRVSGLRKLLNRARAPSLLEFVAPGYRLAINANDVDAQRFLALVGDGRGQRERGDIGAAAETFRRALALWRGEPLADAQGCLSLEAESARLTDARLDATEDWIDAELACGRHEAVHAELDRLVAANPLRERLARQRAVCLYRAGRQAEALAACHELRVRLAEDVGLEPDPQLNLLEHEILERSATLARSTVATDAIPRPHTDGSSAARHRPARAPHPTAVSPRRHTRQPDQRGAERHNLPTELTRFVGRVAELAVVDELLGSFRLITLTGVGGVGKTRLALAAAAKALERYRDGVWLVELAPVRADAAVPSAFSRALDIMIAGDQGPDDVTRALHRSLANRRTLLVVDTAEHVIDGTARVVHQLLASCPELTVIVTSRELLHLPGEAAFAVPPLSLPLQGGDDVGALVASDAVTLFCDRARAARPGAVTSTTDFAAAARICRRVDGLPLAIELAAARVRMLSAHQVAERLDDCLPLLTSDRAAGVPERHRTLRATLDWSYELLAPAERTALRRLAVFSGDFDLDAAIDVVENAAPLGDGDPAGFTLVSRLVDKSLVVIVGGGDDVRYRLLDPIRQYAAEKLAAAGETELLRRRHCDLYLARQEVLWPLMPAQKRHQAHADRDNFFAALEWAWREGDLIAATRLVVIQTTSWMCMGDAQGREWLERILAQPEPMVHPARARALIALALSLNDAGRPCSERIDELLHRAEAIAEQLGDPLQLAACYLSQVEIVLARGGLDEARQLTRAALLTYEGLGVAAGVGWCHHFLGWLAVAEGDSHGARTHFEQALEVARSTPGGEWLLAHALAGLAPVAAQLGDSGYALRLAEEAVSSARPFAARAVLAMALARAAEAAILADAHVAAADALDELLRLLLDLGTRRWGADALEMVTIVLEPRGQHAEAVLALGASEALHEAAGGRGASLRAVAEHVRRSARRLREALGPAGFATYDDRGRSLSPEVAMAEMVVALRVGVELA
jgi:predicted ATPase/DNA-binding SARP family transcriptional activator